MPPQKSKPVVTRYRVEYTVEYAEGTITVDVDDGQDADTVIQDAVDDFVRINCTGQVVKKEILARRSDHRR